MLSTVTSSVSDALSGAPSVVTSPLATTPAASLSPALTNGPAATAAVSDVVAGLVSQQQPHMVCFLCGVVLRYHSMYLHWDKYVAWVSILT